MLDELLPTMADPAAAPSALAVHWANAQPTLDQLDTSLAGLAAEAPDEHRAASARTVADATAEVRRVVTADLALRREAADPSALAASTLIVQAARDKLAAALAPPA